MTKKYDYIYQLLCHRDIFCYRFSASCLYLIKALSLGWKEVEGSWDSMIWPQQMMEHYSLDWVRGTRGNEILHESCCFHRVLPWHTATFTSVCLSYSNSEAVWIFSFASVSEHLPPSIMANVPVTFSPHKSKPCLVTRILTRNLW